LARKIKNILPMPGLISPKLADFSCRLANQALAISGIRSIVSHTAFL
jgi:hypothetical protein